MPVAGMSTMYALIAIVDRQSVGAGAARLFGEMVVNV
jgi:hypothetical protein